MRSGGFGGGRGFGGAGGSFENKVAPVKVGEEVEVVVEAVGAKGDGIAKKEGFVIFVPGAKQGENVRIKITKVLNNMAFSEVVGPATGAASSAPRKNKREERQENGDAETLDEESEPVDTENFGEEN